MAMVRKWMTVLCAGLLATCLTPLAAAGSEVVSQRKMKVDGVDIFYREAGNATKPVIVLLHGFPSSSHMFRDLLPDLSQDFHVFAPDYPGMGNSGIPSDGADPLTFDRVADYIEGFLRAVHADTTILYMQDFGGPVGMRLALRHPDRIAGLIIQNTPVSLDGWEPNRLKALESSKALSTLDRRAAAESRVSLATDILLYRKGANRPDEVSPDAWSSDAFALADPARHKAMTDLQLDIVSNLDLYPAWQAYLQNARPKALVVWGDGDPIFAPRGADAFAEYDTNTVVRHYASGHFALEERHQDIAREIIARFGAGSL